MNSTSWRAPGLALCASLCVMLAACGTSAPSHFYTLSAVPATTPVKTAPAALSLAISAVTIPGTLDRPQMVRFVDAQRLDLLEEARWGEPLAHGIARTLAEDLESRLAVGAVAAYPQDASVRARYRISVDIAHLDVASNGEVILDAIWTLRDTYVAPVAAPGSAPLPVTTTERLKTGHVHITGTSRGLGPEASVAAQSAVLAQLADQLAAALMEFVSPS